MNPLMMKQASLENENPYRAVQDIWWSRPYPPRWEEPGFYNLMYNGTSVYTFYVWGPVLDYINSDKYIGISRIKWCGYGWSPVTIRYSIKEMEGVTITSSRMQICDQNESVLMEIENIPVGENQEIVWMENIQRRNIPSRRVSYKNSFCRKWNRSSNQTS